MQQAQARANCQGMIPYQPRLCFPLCFAEHNEDMPCYALPCSDTVKHCSAVVYAGAGATQRRSEAVDREREGIIPSAALHYFSIGICVLYGD